MQGDIFATKGIEYLIVIGYLLVMVGMVRLFASKRFARAGEAKTRRPVAHTAPWFSLADGRYFHQGHAWAAPDGGEIVTVGLDDFAARVVGQTDGFVLPAVGSGVRQGEPAWSVRADGRALTMLCPVDGTVLAVNPAVIETPRLAADDPYGRGWLLKVHAPNRQASLRNLFSGELATVWMQHTAERLRQLPAGELGVVMPDGGEPVPGFGRVLRPEAWQVITREFFLTG